ncbi:isopeptide-forming domain-containing fimbrial protein [Streptococcus suis]|uniref:isopeptide-forming domain-containing fimbrial protein n=2 Tax=Streptococcus suis TaxID=1307 RepID=UPI00137950F1|nr:isopeptide-forming domain-containing fimbrial protein [Streptococcus suis]
MMFSVLLSQLGMLITSVPNIQAADLGSTTTDGVTTTVSQKGCAIKIETKQEVNWGLPRQPIDLVILQDASGSFKNTIGSVQSALRTLTTAVDANAYDEKNPRLVFTGDEKTTDRVMVATFQGLDGIQYYDNATFYNSGAIYSTGPDTNYTSYNQMGNAGTTYSYKSTNGLLTNSNQVHNFINSIAVGGGTPTVPAIDDVLNSYNQIKNSGGGMANNRKTVFLLVTDGVANGYRAADGRVYIQESFNRTFALQKSWGTSSWPEASQNYLARAAELTQAGDRIKQAIGDDGTVVVGFWEDVPTFETLTGYGSAYRDGTAFERAGINVGDDKRSVQEVFHAALQSVASPDKTINGNPVSFYVNEQTDANRFAENILKAVTSAMIKENIVGDFTVTDGYKVNSVTINGKKVVETVTNENTEIKGSVTQEGTKVTISVPDSIFNPGKNSFEYDLTKTAAEDAALSEDEETDPADGYQPETKTETVGQLTGRFKVGDYVSDEIGSKDPTTVQVTDLKYCYPSATKSITDADQSNDTGQLDDPVVKGKKSYAANLSTFSEGFTYQVLYRMNNAPLNFEANPMLIDKLDYRLEYVDAYVTGQDGQRLNNFNIRTTTGNDALGNQRTIVVADIPEAPGTQTQYVDEGKYGAHKFKQYTLHVKVRIKDQYSNANNPVVYRQILQENDGLGILNQANIVWNGKTNNPEDEEAKTRRSNTVYVKPPVETDIKKDVQSVPNKEAGYKPGNSQEYLENRSQEFYYNVESSWPGLFDTYSISDTLVPELEVISAEVFINDVQNATLTNKLTIDANKQSVALNLVKADITNALNIQIRRATNNYTQPAVVRIGIKAKIRDNANLAKYVVNGEIKVPNEAQVVLNGKPQTSNIVYVTPKEPGISKKINDAKDEHNVLQESEDFTFDIKTKLPDNISAYKSYKIVDVLDERLELKDGAQPFVNAELSQHFDVSYDAATRTVTAAIKPGSFALLSGGETVHLTIPAKVKSGTAFAQIPNEAKVYYRDPSSTGEKETPPTPPVIVTPPPLIEKQVNGKQHADLTKRDEVFEYTIKSTVPKGADTFEITDELDEALEFAGNQGDVVVKIADTVVTDAVEVSAVGRNLGIKFTKEQLTNDAGKPIVVTFKAKIRGDANLSADKYVQTGTTLIPNTAKYILNNNPKESNEVTVTPPIPPTPTVDKKVNGQAHENLTNRDQTFEYSISTQVPTDAKKFEITDELKDVLEFAGADGKGEVVVKIGDKDVTQDTTVKTENQNLTINLTSDQLSKLQGQAVVVTFKAKIRANVNLSDYITDGAVKVPNVANITVDNKPKVTSEPVTVTPPTPTDPTVDKLVNNQVHADLPQRDEVFEYTINTQVPTDAKSFEITDELKDVLEFTGADGKGDVVVKIGDKDVTKESTVTVAGQQLSVQLSATHLKDDAGKAVVVTFKSKIRANVNLTGYLEEGSNTIKIPNTASISVDHKPKVDSKPVTVTPPTPNNPTIVKEVNKKQHEDLTNREDVFEYTIQTQVPTDAKSFEITDELVEVLEFAGAEGKGDVVVTIGDTTVTDAVTIATSGQNLSVKLSPEQLQKDSGKAVVVTFKAKIRANANLSGYLNADDNTTKIPNTASFTIDNKPKENSNPVTVTPPTPPTPTVDKKVNGQAHENLTNRDQTFEYSISTQVPTDAKKFEITDELKEVLEFAGADGKGEVVVKIGDKDVTQETTVKTENQNLTINLTSDQLSKLQGQAVVVTFKAKIRANVNLSDYITDGAVKVPNVANITVDNKPKVTSEPVTVTPPSPENPPIVKDVNGADRADLATREESFTYHITSAVPTDATAFELSDTLVDVLEFDGEKGGATVTIDGKDASADATIAVQDQRLTVTLSEAQVKANGGKEVVVTFKAKIRPGANLSAYKVDGKTEIPNTAEYVINNNPETKKKSNEVPVTPPSPENPPIVKDVNGADRADLATREESFTYHITSAVPTDATAFELSDTLVDVLEFDGEKGGATVTIDGKDASADATIAVQDQRLTVTLSEAQVKANGGKEVVVTFKAKIRPGANLSAYKVDGKTEIPNTAEYVINNNPETKKKSNEVPVTPPSPENPPIVKDVNGKESDTLANRYDVFTYHISTSVPNDATAFTITDTLVPVLEFSGDIAVEIDGKLISANTTIDNQTLTVDLTEEQVRNNGGKPVVVTFNAKIRSGANLSAYIVDGKTAVPNTAEYVINNNPETKKKSNEVPVYPPTPEGGEPEIDKKINKTLDYLEIARGKSYNYDITTTIPEDIVDYKEFVITDQVDSALQINGDVVVDIDGYSAEGIVDVVVDGQAVTVAVKDFSKLEGRSAIHIFIPATIRPEADLSTYVDNSVPNTANLHFTNGPGVTKDKSTVPVIVTPPTPPTPVPPTPGDPTKTVNTADGNEQAFHLDLLQRTSDFRYDIAYTIEADSQYTAFTMEDTLESVLNIQRVAIKVGSGENLVLKEFAELEAKLAEAKATLETLEAKKTEITNTVSSVATMATELEAQKVRIAEIEQELAIKEAELATASTASTTTPSTTEETDGTSVVDENTDNSQPVVDKQAEIQALTVAIEQLKASKDQVQQTVVELEQQIEVANTSEASLAALEVEIRNATASIEELEKQLAEKAPKATVAREVEAALLAVNEKGELTDASAAILGQVSIDKATNHVVFDITNPDVLASLRGRQVTMSIYATINPEADLSNYVTDKGIELVPNTASVTFDRNPQTKKKTNTVTVTPPPLPEPPGPPTPLPPLPPVEPPVPSDPPTQPTPPTPPTTPPAESTPPTPGKTLPKTGVAENGMYALVGMILGTLTLVFRRRKQ